MIKISILLKNNIRKKILFALLKNLVLMLVKKKLNF